MSCSISSCPHWSEAAAGCTLGEPGKQPAAPPGQPPGGSLVLASLEIGKVLADRDRVAFRAQGTCMYPTVRPGDVLQLQSRTVEEIVVGDIAVCRRPGYLFGHRTIGKGVNDGRPYIVTRPDRTRQGDDGPTYDEHVLGIVTAIERGGQPVQTDPKQYPWPVRLYLAGRLAWVEYRFAARNWLIAALTRVQRSAGYQRAARPLLASGRANVSYVVRLPLRARQTHDLYRPLPPEEFDVADLTWQGRPVNCWTLALHLMNGDRQPAAWATFVLRPPECPHAGWWVDDLQVRVRYRGAGLAADLISKAEEILARGGTTLQRSEERE